MKRRPAALRRSGVARCAGSGWRAAALFLALAPATAQSGAWTRPENDAFVSVSTSYYRTDGASPYEEATVDVYGEYGWSDWLTLGAQAEIKRPVGDSAALDGDVTLAGFAQARLWTGAAGDPVSVRVAARTPLGDVAGGRPPQIGDDYAAEARLLYGRGFETRFGPGWADAQAAFRWNAGDDADELRLDFTIGVRPAARWLVMAQSLNTIGLRNARGRGDDFDVYKLAPAIGYELTERVSLLIGVEREIAGRDIDRGLRFRVGVWSTF